MTLVIYDDHFFAIEDQVTELVNQVITSQSFKQYLEAKQAMSQNPEVQQLRTAFSKDKADFEKIAKYGNYAPDFKEKQRNVRKSKRKLDLQPIVAEFRYRETQLQGILDQISLVIAQSISSDIKVDAGNPFFEKKSSCGGHCHGS